MTVIDPGRGRLLKGVEEGGLHASAVEVLAEPLGDGADGDEAVALLGGGLGLDDEVLNVSAVLGAGAKGEDDGVLVDEVLRAPGGHVDAAGELFEGRLGLAPWGVGGREVVRKLAARLLGLAQLVRALLGLPCRLDDVGRTVADDDGVARKVVEQPTVVEEPGVEVGVLDLVAVEEEVNLLADALAGLGVAVVHVDGAHEVVDVIGVREAGQGLRSGQDVDGLDELGGALGGWIEEADGVDLVAPEVDAGGELRADGEDIEDAAAPSRRARQVYGRLEGVSHAPPPVEQLAQVEGLAGDEPVQALLEALAGDGLLGDGGGGGDDDVGAWGECRRRSSRGQGVGRGRRCAAARCRRR